MHTRPRAKCSCVVRNSFDHGDSAITDSTAFFLVTNLVIIIQLTKETVIVYNCLPSQRIVPTYTRSETENITQTIHTEKMVVWIELIPFSFIGHCMCYIIISQLSCISLQSSSSFSLLYLRVRPPQPECRCVPRYGRSRGCGECRCHLGWAL